MSYSTFKLFTKQMLHPVMMLFAALYDRTKIGIMGNAIPPHKNYIYAVNHSNGHDFPVTAKVIKRHFYILADFTMKNDIFADLVNRLNGCIYVDRLSKESRKQSKEEMLFLLKSGKSVLLFPEGTWNLTPNLMTLPLNWGIIELSQLSGVPILPLTINYYGKKAVVNIGEAYLPSQEKTKKENIDALRESLATLLYNSQDYLPTISRKDLSNGYYEVWLKKQLATYKKLDYEYEMSVVRKEYETHEQAFEHLKRIQPNLNNAFLWNKRIK